MQLEEIKTMKEAETYLKSKSKIKMIEGEYILKNIKHDATFLEKYKGKLYWNNICLHGNVSMSFINKYKDKINFHLLIRNINCPLKVYTQYTNKLKEEWDYISKIELPVWVCKKISSHLNWSYVSILRHLSEDFIREFQNKVDWYYISKYQHLSETFIREFQDKVNWRCISGHQSLSEDFTREFIKRIDLTELLSNYAVSENFLRDYMSGFDGTREKPFGLRSITAYQKLSESFIRDFADSLDWVYISQYQHLSEDMIREFKDKVVWYYISKYQHLSEEFIKEFKDRVDWDCIANYQYLSDNFICEFSAELSRYMVLLNKNWVYKSTEFKKQAVIDTGLYECYDDYFIAYKGIRSDRYSAYNFQYQYLPNETYECFADSSDCENSFGLSVWNYAMAKDYCSELVVKCKVYYKDVARVVHNGGKIRCSKITVLD